jgi:hypothetical protein
VESGLRTLPARCKGPRLRFRNRKCGGNGLALDLHLISFAGEGVGRAGVDLGVFWWYQEQAGLAGFSSKFWRAPRPDSIGALCVFVKPAPDRSIVAGFLSTRNVLTGFRRPGVSDG